MAGGTDIALIAVTRRSQPEDKDKARKAGFDEHLTKPVDLSLLATLIGAVSVSRSCARISAANKPLHRRWLINRLQQYVFIESRLSGLAAVNRRDYFRPMSDKDSGDLTATGELRCTYRFGGDMRCSLPEGHDEDHYIVVAPLVPPESQPQPGVALNPARGRTQKTYS